ncbi:MAG: hypothetical protein NTZ01_07120 [Verrucomicrobia bacterium]|nr:hypothetical protein [Verrucomicrobiota bacterium]
MRLWSLAFLGGLSLFFLSLALAQEAKKEEKVNVVLGKPMELEMVMVTVPDSVGSGGKPAPAIEDRAASQEGRWLRIDVPFSTTNKFTPEVKFKFYLEGYERVTATEGEKMTEKLVVLTGEATYRDVPAGKKHFAGVFMPPASVLRFAGLKPGGEMEWSKGVMNLKVEATEGGAPVEKVFDLQSDKEKGPSGRGGKKDPEWNKSSEAQEVSGFLLPIYETPFWPKDYKRYSQPKKP